MFHFDAYLKVYLHRKAVDFRKSINGLATLVEQSMGRDPFARAAGAEVRDLLPFNYAKDTASQSQKRTGARCGEMRAYA